jgi:hypothetical protein
MDIRHEGVVISPMRIAHLRQRLRSLGAKPCHEDRLLRGWTQVCSYDRAHSPAETFFPLALRNALPTIEADLNGLVRLHGEYPSNGLENHERSPSPTWPHNAGEGAIVDLRVSSNND